MIGHNDMRPFADVEFRYIYTEMTQFFHFRDETFGVNNNAIANNTGGVWVKNARWNKTKSKFSFFVHNPVSCIAASLVAHDILCIHRQLVYNLPFTLVSPLCSNNCNNRHKNVPSQLYVFCHCYDTPEIQRLSSVSVAGCNLTIIDL